MIIRIMGEGQFHVNSSLFDELNDIDNAIVASVQQGDEPEYARGLARLVEMIHEHGSRVPDEELVESDIVVPPPDLTMEEAADVFTGDGVFKD